FRDHHFDLQRDRAECLFSLVHAETSEAFNPAGSKRINDIFERPTFFADGTAGDITQSTTSDNWFLCALATVSGLPGLIEMLCVARDEGFGVYGFIFFSHGEWISTVVDDLVRKLWDSTVAGKHLQKMIIHAGEYMHTKALKNNSDGLYFSRCHVQNETWLLLLEKVCAKSLGDSEANRKDLRGSEGIEDITGGVTTELFTRDLLDPDRFWNEELLQVNKDFLFGCSVQIMESEGKEQGDCRHTDLHCNLTYNVLRAVKVNGKRLVFIRNPWGKTAWTDPWSDGSADGTTLEWATALNHRFGNDGYFWMEFSDFLEEWASITRSCLFDPSWTVASQWVEVSPIWPAVWGQVHFVWMRSSLSPVVIVLSQLDTRYFKDLTGPFNFHLQLRIYEEGNESGNWIGRAFGTPGQRSVNMELDFPAGRYIVYVKIDRVLTAAKIDHPLSTS
ncbi:hypothetical protein BDK51DRAFT_17293, partial [Blyttiomyces helicus]